MSGLIAGLFAIFATVGLAACAITAPVTVPRVLLSREHRVYIAMADSLSMLAGDSLGFVLHDRPIAAGIVSGVMNGELAVASLTSGSLDGEKHLDEIAIFVNRPPLRARSVLRVGCLAPRRLPATWPIQAPLPRAVSPSANYRLAARDPRGFRLVRDSLDATAPWPDTLIMRWFDDNADEEIALERGELDIALFWPGELSTRLRERPRWQGVRFGNRSRGAIAWIAVARDRDPAPISVRMPSRADSIQVIADVHDHFRGDLRPWVAADSAAAWTTDRVSPGEPADMRNEAPLGPVGRDSSNRLRDRSALQPGRFAGPALRRIVLDASPDSLDSLAHSLAGVIRAGRFSRPTQASADSVDRLVHQGTPDGWASGPRTLMLLQWLRESLGVVDVFPMRCAIVAAPELTPFVEALGTGAIVDLMGQWPAEPGR